MRIVFDGFEEIEVFKSGSQSIVLSFKDNDGFFPHSVEIPLIHALKISEYLSKAVVKCDCAKTGKKLK